eukprot:15451482-Alexandrium_andersonii.AAC.1
MRRTFSTIPLVQARWGRAVQCGFGTCPGHATTATSPHRGALTPPRLLRANSEANRPARTLPPMAQGPVGG